MTLKTRIIVQSTGESYYAEAQYKPKGFLKSWVPLHRVWATYPRGIDDCVSLCKARIDTFLELKIQPIIKYPEGQ